MYVGHWLTVEMRSKHGTYRPNLAKLVAENSLEEVRKTTRNAFSSYATDNTTYAKSVTALSKLKGLGPATASLILACYDPVQVSFFSDELFRYLHWEDAKSGEWDRKINYSMKEYKDLFERVQALRRRLEKESGQVIDVEKCAYVLTKGVQQYNSHMTGDSDSDNDALRAPSPKRRKRASPELSLDPVSVCQRKGPLGSPTYDELGYELDYEYLCKTSSRPRPLSGRAMRRLEEKQKESERKADILRIDAERRKAVTAENAWDDRIAKDLGVAFHEVGIEEYEEWKKRGFHVDPSEFDNLSQEEKDRLSQLETGCALRKGSKHR